MKYYAGIGSRETPANILVLMEKVARRLRALGYTLRSGGAAGADSAFENGADSNKEIFLPWSGYNGNRSVLAGTFSKEEMMLAEKFHPNWQACSQGARKLHARNVQIILGQNGGNPVDFVICWTRDGLASGGTGQAIRIANSYGIPIFNLFKNGSLKDLANLVR